MKWRFLLAAVFLLSFCLTTYGHLCNDVFVQAKDNLVVKVDVRDGQLRISDTGTFRVYLLNTMDRDIAKIMLEVLSKDFEAEVTPGSDWRGYPQLKTTNRGGKKEYFEVELKRKRRTKEGKYKIALHLHGGKKNLVFKTVDINDAMALMEVPEKPRNLKIDGKITSSEWRKALLCSNFYEYKKSGRYMQNFPASKQSRFRFYRDGSDLICCADFQEKCSDTARIFISKDQDTSPMEVVIDLGNKKVTLDGEEKGIEAQVDSRVEKMEIKIPLAFLDEQNEEKDKKKSICVNLVRECGGTTTYWRGNSSSYKNPVVFANFVMSD